jgi:hypothetical protein
MYQLRNFGVGQDETDSMSPAAWIGIFAALFVGLLVIGAGAKRRV